MANIVCDEPPLQKIARSWLQYQEELSLLSQLCIKRLVLSPDCVSCDQHAFCDASERRFAVAIYFQDTYSDAAITTYFICGKSKVAPIKKTIPRLELIAALLKSEYR